MNFLSGFKNELLKLASGENNSDVSASDFADLGQWDKGWDSVQENGDPVINKQSTPQDVEFLNTRQSHFMGRFAKPEPSRRAVRQGLLSNTDGSNDGKRR